MANMICPFCKSEWPADFRWCMEDGSELEQNIGQYAEEKSDGMGLECPECGARIDPRDEFCASCGVRLQSRDEALAASTQFSCPQCNGAVAPGEPFCGRCGARMGEEEAAPQLIAGASALVCPNCSIELPDGTIFCHGCGYQFMQTGEIAGGATSYSGMSACPNCGMALQPGEVFCGSCGYNLGGAAPAAYDAAQAYAPQPDYAVQQAYAAPQAVGAACPNCGADARPGETFCGTCGYNLTPVDGIAPAAVFDSYAPPAQMVAQPQPDYVPAPDAGAASCPNCGMEIMPGETFCGTCGYNLTPVVDIAPAPAPAMPPVAEQQPAAAPPAPMTPPAPAAPSCPNCGMEVLPGETFCGTCGFNFGAPAEAPAPPVAFPPPPPAAAPPPPAAPPTQAPAEIDLNAPELQVRESLLALRCKECGSTRTTQGGMYCAVCGAMIGAEEDEPESAQDWGDDPADTYSEGTRAGDYKDPFVIGEPVDDSQPMRSLGDITGDELVCPACGLEAYPGHDTCVACGVRLVPQAEAVQAVAATLETTTKPCPSCGMDLMPADEFCPNCGQGMAQDAAPPPVEHDAPPRATAPPPAAAPGGEKVCSCCGNANPASSEFCGVCGVDFD